MNHRRVHTAADFGEAVRAARSSRNLDQAELAERTNVARMTISRLENGGPVNIETAVRALSELGYEIVVVPKFARIEIG